jgi:hypothetical protein
MATQASSYGDYEPAGGQGAPPPEGRKERSDPCRVRALPNEDIYFYRKPIDNSTVQRQSDPAARSRSWRRIALAAGGTTALAACFWPNVYGMVSGYQVERLKKEQSRLLAHYATLAADEARLMGPERLKELALGREFTEPAASQLVFLAPEPDGSLALNTQGK